MNNFVDICVDVIGVAVNNFPQWFVTFGCEDVVVVFGRHLSTPRLERVLILNVVCKAINGCNHHNGSSSIIGGESEIS